MWDSVSELLSVGRTGFVEILPRFLLETSGDSASVVSERTGFVVVMSIFMLVTSSIALVAVLAVFLEGVLRSGLSGLRFLTLAVC